MQRSDFVIGEDFLTAIGRWRCTDIGTRTISAIRWPDPEYDPVEARQSTLWLQGPPYVLPEEVFDEQEMASAYRTITEAINSSRQEVHPGFESEDVSRMMESEEVARNMSHHAERYRRPLLRYERVRGEQVLHAYDWREGDENVVLALDIFARAWLEVSVEEWLTLPIARHEDLERASRSAS